MSTLPEVLNAEIFRCRRVAQDCASLGSSGAFAGALLSQALRDAEKALSSRDLTAIQQAVSRLREVRDVLPESPVRSAPARPVPIRPARPGMPAWAPARAPAREQFFTWTRRAA